MYEMSYNCHTLQETGRFSPATTCYEPQPQPTVAEYTLLHSSQQILQNEPILLRVRWMIVELRRTRPKMTRVDLQVYNYIEASPTKNSQLFHLFSLILYNYMYANRQLKRYLEIVKASRRSIINIQHGFYC